MSSVTAFRFGLLFFMVLVGMSVAQLLGQNFYARSCPQALQIIRSGVLSAVQGDRRMGASLLRLHFHDCFVNGCDASVLLDDTSNFIGEKTAGPNANSLRGFEVIDAIKSRLERACPGVVSCADTLAVVARDSVMLLGGIGWGVTLGRRDSTNASFSAANTNIPGPASNLNGLIASFASKGLSAREMVTLSGAHTIGQARCTTFRGRLYGETNIDRSFAAGLRRNCPRAGGDNIISPLDAVSPRTFDNAYYRNLRNRRGLLHSDQQLFNNGSADSQVNAYASNLGLFQRDFAAAMVKMGNITPLTGTRGQIRRNCRKTN